MSDVLFICRCNPYDYFNVYTTVQDAVAWAKRNRDSAGELQIKRVRWDMLQDSKVVQFKPTNINVKEDIKDMDNVESLRLVTGGKSPPDDGSWISTLMPGSIFLVEAKQGREPALGQFILMERTQRSVCLMSPDAPGKQLWQNPHRFCAMYNLREVLGVVDIPEIPKKEEENDEGDRVECSNPPDVQPS